MPRPLKASHGLIGGVEEVREDDDAAHARGPQLVTHDDTSWAAIGKISAAVAIARRPLKPRLAASPSPSEQPALCRERDEGPRLHARLSLLLEAVVHARAIVLL